MNAKLHYDLCSTCNDSWLKNVIFKIQIISPDTDRIILDDAAIQRVSQRAIAAVAAWSPETIEALRDQRDPTAILAAAMAAR
jgi:hypothetical protein